MTASDWGDWLPRDIESATPDTVAIWYLGCNGFVLKGRNDTTIFIDPYVGLGDPPRTIRMIPVPFDPHDITHTEAILVTHEHADHMHGPSLGPILANTEGILYCPDDCRALVREENWTAKWNFSMDQVHPVSEGDIIQIGEFTIAVEHSYDPNSTHPVTYRIDHESGTVFHGGDTFLGDDFKRIGTEHDIDIGILALGAVGNLLDRETGERVSTRWYLDENEVIEVARHLQIDRLVPSHWDMWKGMTIDPKSLHHHSRSFEYPQKLEIVEIGDRIDL